MKILLYLLVPLLIVAVAAGIQWARNRQPTSLESGVDAFQREMRALSPDDAPLTRRREPGSGAAPAGLKPGPGSSPPKAQPPRRPPSPDRPR